MLSRAAARNGDKTCLVFLPDKVLTYAQLEDAANRVANGLKAIGIGHGSHVAVFTDNRLDQIVSYFALAKLGAVCVPVNTIVRGYFLERFLVHSDSTAIIVEPELLPALADVADAAPRLDTLILYESLSGASPVLADNLAARRIIHFDSLLQAPPTPVDDAASADLAQILYTSGTTGPSKGNMFGHTAMLNWARQISAAKGLSSNDVFLSVFPLYHGGAWLNATLAMMWVNGAIAVARKFSASQFWDQARQCGATKAMLIGVTSILTAQAPSPADRDHQIKFFYGAPPPPDLGAFEQRFGARFFGGYGLTDYGTSHFSGPSDIDLKPGALGRPYPGWRVKIADDQGRELPPGQAGEILLRCDIPGGAATGYYKMPEETLEARRDLWHHTGDLGYVDEDDYLYFVDRKKDAIRRRGENMSSFELEMVLRRLPGVADAAFFPVRIDDDEDVGVAVILSPGMQIECHDVVNYCRQQMPKFAVPRFVRIMEAFPQTGSGKVRKQVIRSETEAMLGHVWDREAPMT